MNNSNRIALVTAGSSGLGLACAHALAADVSHIMICARGAERLEEAARQLREHSDVHVVPVVADLADSGTPKLLIERCIEELGGLDVLVTNVGHPKMGSVDMLQPADWRDGFEQVFMTTLDLVQCALPAMRQRGFGRIVNISSHAVKEPGSTYLISAVFRTALASLFKALSHEVGVSGVTVNTVCPGFIRTPLGDALIRARADQAGVSVAEAELAAAAPNAVARIGEPAHVGALVAFLCSDAAAHITGQVLSVDGGKGRGLF